MKIKKHMTMENGKIADEINSAIMKCREEIKKILLDSNIRYWKQELHAMSCYNRPPCELDFDIDTSLDEIVPLFEKYELSRCLHDVDDMKKLVEEYEDSHSPQARAAKHYAEYMRLKDKYGLDESEIAKYVN